jgi:hypothetical protein
MKDERLLNSNREEVMKMFLGLCVVCGCKIYSDWIEQFDGHYCNHELQTNLDERQVIDCNEDPNQKRPHAGR